MQLFMCAVYPQGVSGGAIPPRVGDALSGAGVKVVQLYAATEFGTISRLVRRAGDDEWAYAEMSDMHRLRWAPQGDGTYELQILVRSPPLSRAARETQHAL